MRPKELKHAPSLDGIRGIAIISVLIFHLDWAWLPGGFLGVDIFFALSGFLATTLLLEEQFKFGRISLKRYFVRRGLRLYPAMVALVIVSSFFTLHLHRELGLRGVLNLGIPALTYCFNWVSLAIKDGWLGGMTHIWSLAIEGQFYLFWAVLVAFVCRHYASTKERKSLLKTLIVAALMIAVASSLWRAILWSQGAPWFRTYLGTDTRLDGLFIGAAAAILRLQWLRQATPCCLLRISRFTTGLIEISCVSILVLLLATVGFRQSHFGLFGFTVTAVATSVLMLISVMRTDSILGPFFRWAALTWIGRISYSVYIWHMPAKTVFSSERLIARGLSPFAAESIRFTIMIVLGAASYYIIERTFMKLQRRFKPKAPSGDEIDAIIPASPPEPAAP